MSCTGRLICTEGSEFGTLCTAGFYIRNGDYGLLNECLGCPAGTYSTIEDGYNCLTCPGGYLCYGETNRKQPTDYQSDHGEICPKGFYCEEAALEALPCPIGTYNAEYGASSIT